MTDQKGYSHNSPRIYNIIRSLASWSPRDVLGEIRAKKEKETKKAKWEVINKILGVGPINVPIIFQWDSRDVGG